MCGIHSPSQLDLYKQLSYDIIEQIEKDLLNFKTKVDILICGDFNARTATEPDFISDDTPKYLPLSDSYNVDNTIRIRNNHDTVLDTRGKELLEFCIGNQLRIMNGRGIGDFLAALHVLIH